MINRYKEFKEQNYMIDTQKKTSTPIDFNKIKIGLKTINDATYTQGDYKSLSSRVLGDKARILKAIEDRDYSTMREISDYFYRISGIYSRLCKYMANLYRYDWFVTPYIDQTKAVDNKKVISEFNKVLRSLDEFEAKRTFGEIALKVIRKGVYYGYLVKMPDNSFTIQELPAKYCRSRFKIKGRPAVEFNLSYFDEAFKDSSLKLRMLNLFPDEFKKAYVLYKDGKLAPDSAGDSSGWYLLDIDLALKFNISDENYPLFISVIPAIIDLNDAQELDRKKMEQELLKIIIQKMPIDKNGDLVFDVDEAQALHNNAVTMLKRAIGIDVLTTFADVDVADMSDDNNVSSNSLNNVERALFNESGVPEMLFNTSGNLALEKSILNDEASIYNMILQFQSLLNHIIDLSITKNKKFYFKAEMLSTTIYNYKEMAKMYKEQTQIGYSKMLPAIALGHSQSSVLATAYFEKDVLDLLHLFVPPMSSSTMSADALETLDVGRPKKSDDEKAEKTIQNEESLS